VLVGGPTGVGKSTELAQAAAALAGERVACFIPLDRSENMRRLTAGQLLFRVSDSVASVARTHELGLSRALAHALDYEENSADLARATLREVTRISHKRRITLLIDGLEKVPEGPETQEIFDALGLLADEAEVVAVVPWYAAFGPRADTVIQAGERFVAVRGVNVAAGHAGEDGRAFLAKVLLRRLELPNGALEDGPLAHQPTLIARRNLVADACAESGGIPRTFLQLMADAASYAEARRGIDWPREEDFRDACLDQSDSFRRLLLPGDEAALRAAVGTDGRELELGRKIRLMAHGILLERLENRQPVLEIHPLAKAFLGNP
jgi:hypothetical protein